MKVPQSRNCQKSGKGRLGEDLWKDGSTRRHQTSLKMESWHRKVGHALARETQSTGEDQSMAACGQLFADEVSSDG